MFSNSGRFSICWRFVLYFSRQMAILFKKYVWSCQGKTIDVSRISEKNIIPMILPIKINPNMVWIKKISDICLFIIIFISNKKNHIIGFTFIMRILSIHWYFIFTKTKTKIIEISILLFDLLWFFSVLIH